MTAAHSPAPPRLYSRAEDLSDAVVHIAGLAVVCIAVPVLIVLAAVQRGDLTAMVGTSVYSGGLIAMILCSALYNMVRRPGWAWLLQRLDHAAIYLKIAGTYTAFVLLAGQGGMLALVVWAAAGVGVLLKAISPERFRPVALALYLGMGWAGVIGGGDLLAALPGMVVGLMLAGGAIYSLGVGFYLWQGLRFHYTVWHICVLAATLVFYAAVLVAVISEAPVA